MPRCPFRWATGLDCPGCGGLRMVHDLLHGQVGAALADNAVLVVLAPVLILLVGRSAWRWVHGRPVTGVGRAEVNGRLGRLLVGVAILWTVIRNLIGA